MRKVKVGSIRVGMILAKTIFTEDGRILLAEGVVLTKAMLERLELCNITEIYVEDEVSEGISATDVIHEETRVEAKVLVNNIFHDSRVMSHFNASKIQMVVGKIIDELLENEQVVLSLSDIKTTDDYTFSHSVNVCVLSLITGIRLGIDKSMLHDLGIGSLLHDIGKIEISDNILKKPSGLDDEETVIIRQHSEIGYELLKANGGINEAAAIIALQHHERIDGSGYPVGAKGEEIHIYARIVAIADVYDALTSDRVYRKKMLPYEVVEYISNVGYYHFDQRILKCFLHHIALYPVGTGVILNTGQRGIIASVNYKVPTRPMVRVIYNADGTRIKPFEEVDMMQQLNLTIIDVCDID